MTDAIRLVTTPTVSQEIKEEAIDLLERYLAEAHAGRLENVLVVAKHTDKDTSFEHTTLGGFANWIGDMEIVKQRMIARYFELKD